MHHHKIKLWLDCDPGNDDSMAIILAAYTDTVELVGVSTLFGNTSVQLSTRNAIKILSSIGRSDIPVFQGASQSLRSREPKTDMHGEEGLFGAEQLKGTYEAITEGNLYKFIKNRVGDEKFTFVMTGAQTNLALLLQDHEDILDQIDQVVFMGGTTQQGNITPNAEFNIFCDPEAAQIVLDCCQKHNKKIAMIGLDVTEKALVTDQFKQNVKNLNTKLTDWCSDMLYAYQKAYKVQEFDLSPLHDPVALYYAIHPEHFTQHHVFVEIETTSQLCYGRTTVDKRGVYKKEPNVYYCSSVKQEHFWNDMMNAIAIAAKHSQIE